jgi:DNA-binding response OmpR family regulator
MAAMSGARILVVDDDPWIVSMVKTVLEQRGHQLWTAVDGEAALAKAQEVTPDVIISDILMPRLDGWALIKRLRSSPRLAFVPVIFLTALGAKEDRIRGFRLGADDYLTKPFRFDELELRVKRVLERANHARTTGLHGMLEQFGLSSILVILDMEKKSGILSVRHDNETGRLMVREGRVVAAGFDGKEAPRHADAVYRLLGWSEGAFEFAAGEVRADDEVQCTTTQLLLEAARRIDESAR